MNFYSNSIAVMILKEKIPLDDFSWVDFDIQFNLSAV